MSTVDIRKVVMLSPEASEIIKSNPAGLTKEGVEYEFAIAERSSNKYIRMKYKQMLEKCQTLKPSKLITDQERNLESGEPIEVKKIVLAYDDENQVRWKVSEIVFEEAKKQAERIRAARMKNR